MPVGEGRVLGVDFGTSHTVAMLRWPGGRIKPLLFDGTPLLPSAVFAPEGEPDCVVGNDALHQGRHVPAALEPNPKRRIDDGAVLLGAREFTVVDLIAAVLTRVAHEAERVAGPPDALVLSHPAGWGPVRRLMLSDAARTAGLPAPAFVPEPVAAARFFTSVLGGVLRTGETLLVYDLGAGTFDVSVIRAGAEPHILGSDGIADVGGLDIDAALVQWLRPRYDDASWQRLVNPSTVEDRRLRMDLWSEVRIGKEMLSRTATAHLRPPLLPGAVPLTGADFANVARPLIDRTVRTATALTRYAEVDVAHLLLVGGSSRLPLVQTALVEAFGVAPTVTEQPETVVAEGCLVGWADPDPAAALHDSGLLWPERTSTTLVPFPAPVPAPRPPGWGSTAVSGPETAARIGPAAPTGHPAPAAHPAPGAHLGSGAHLRTGAHLPPASDPWSGSWPAPGPVPAQPSPWTRDETGTGAVPATRVGNEITVRLPHLDGDPSAAAPPAGHPIFARPTPGSGPWPAGPAGADPLTRPTGRPPGTVESPSSSHGGDPLARPGAATTGTAAYDTHGAGPATVPAARRPERVPEPAGAWGPHPPGGASDPRPFVAPPPVRPGRRRGALLALGMFVLVVALIGTLVGTGVLRLGVPSDEPGDGTGTAGRADPGLPPWPLKYGDSLATPRNWAPTVQPNEQATCGFVDGGLEVEMRKGGTFRCPGQRDEESDFAITVEVTLARRSPCAGIWFRFGRHENGAEAGYLLKVCRTRLVAGRHRADGAIEEAREFPIPEIAERAATRVALVAQGDHFRFRHDGREVGDWQDGSYPRGRVALGIAVSKETGAGAVRFRDVRVFAP